MVMIKSLSLGILENHSMNSSNFLAFKNFVPAFATTSLVGYKHWNPLGSFSIYSSFL